MRSPDGDNEKCYVRTFEERVVILKSSSAALDEPPRSEKKLTFSPGVPNDSVEHE